MIRKPVGLTAPHRRVDDDDDIQDKPQRTWVGLTDEEIKELDLSNYVQVVRIVEAKLKEKNG